MSTSYDMNKLLDLMHENEASDLHFQVGVPPMIRVKGALVPIEGPDLTPEEVESMMHSIASDTDIEKTQVGGSADFAFSYMDKARYRVNIMKTKGNFGIAMRQIPTKIMSLEEIGYPEVVKGLLHRPRGLILVTGPTGSGKTTTLASMIDWINTYGEGHIITIEDPIEYYFKHNSCLVTQREIGSDATGFSDALRSALRQDPDYILVGELRDLETVKAAISAAETGHLVFATLHTTGAARSVDRMVHAFPADMRDEIRTELGNSIVAIISQLLVPKIGGGLVSTYEIMVRTDAIAKLIRDNKTFRIASEIQTGSNLGMITLDAHLQYLYTSGVIRAETAIDKSQYPEEMKMFIEKSDFEVEMEEDMEED